MGWVRHINLQAFGLFVAVLRRLAARAPAGGTFVATSRAQATTGRHTGKGGRDST